MTFAKPWERPKEDKTVKRAKVEAATPPWEAAPPHVETEILDAYRQQAAIAGTMVRMDEAFAMLFARAFCTTHSPLETMYECGLADPNEDVSRVIKRYRKYAAHPLVKAAVQNIVMRFTETDILNRDRVIYGLYQEAADRSPFTTASARVAAWAKLATLMGMDPTEEARRRKEDAEQQLLKTMPTSGVMLLPAPAGIEEWEAAAMGQQKQLKADVRT